MLKKKGTTLTRAVFFCYFAWIYCKCLTLSSANECWARDLKESCIEENKKQGWIGRQIGAWREFNSSDQL